MAIGIVKTINGVKQLVPLTTDSGQGLPLGAWTSFEDDQPRNGYLKAGTTFNQSEYPALYNMLGTNVVPERFDHSRLGDWENITLPTTSGTAIEMQYDGFICGYSAHAFDIYINNVRFIFSDNDGAGSMIAFKKGDIIYASASNYTYARVAYYTHPMFIKAVIGPIEDSAADQVVQNVNNSRSYSTEEVNTGKKWIDGKPIYRKTWVWQSLATSLDLSSFNVDEIVKKEGFLYLSNGEQVALDSMFHYAGGNIWFEASYNKSTKLLSFSVGGTFRSDETVTLEYTKTTD